MPYLPAIQYTRHGYPIRPTMEGEDKGWGHRPLCSLTGRPPKPRTNTPQQQLFCPFYNRSARAGPKCGSKQPLGVISATDWCIIALASPTPDLHDDSCTIVHSITAHDGPSMTSGCVTGGWMLGVHNCLEEQTERLFSNRTLMANQCLLFW